MLAYIICLIALWLAIRYEQYLNSPNMDKALGELEDIGFEFGKYQWRSCNDSTALGIDQDKETICLIYAREGWRQIEFEDLVEFELDDKPIKRKRSFWSLLFARKSSGDELQHICVHLINDDFERFDFPLLIYQGNNPEKIKEARKEAREILTVLKLIKFRAQKKQLRELQAIRRTIAKSKLVKEIAGQKKFSFNG
ncbi:MAG: hypothetical protein JW745_03105 [Sedimentisphaerales bacterium]|nr:hypothetical protein [Sedimentisphaerales bacterium]MBN2842776.1 hypothetical protein [Sedimentisphaerales bacterium]